MLVSYRVHLFAAVISAISLIFTAIALFTCHWTDLSGGVFSYPVGLYSQARCSYVNSGWNTATLVFMILAFIFQCLLVLHVVFAIFFRRHHVHLLKIDTTLISLATICLLLAMIIYSIGGSVYWNKRNANYSMGYSFVLGWIAFGISLLAWACCGHGHRRIYHAGDCECNGWYY